MTTSEYLAIINQRYELGNATEHTFRGDLQTLIESLCPEIQATNEPKRQACGAPDYILTKRKNGVPKGYIEAKDIGDKDLAGQKNTGNKEQFDRYKEALNNLIFTDYLEFHFYQNKELIKIIPIAALKNGKIVPLPNNFASFERQIKDFVLFNIESISSPEKLAEMMASKTKLLAEIIENAVKFDQESQENSELKEQIEAFRKILIKDIDAQTFSDVYAQTIAYGMFAARYHDQSLGTFSRQEAALLIPASNPFLKKLFNYIADEKFDVRIKWVVDDLVEIFLHSNIEEILAFGKNTQTEEPIIHFYETFLSKYDPNLRKARGVWYTPAPVVNFMVRAVDHILKTNFELSEGLADTSKINIRVKEQNKLSRKEVHKVQILDPATGTGTFLAEIIKHIHEGFDKERNWSDYVKNHLLPRLNGFELLMASYAMAHLQLDLLLAKTGFKTEENERLRIFLTNSLEEAGSESPNLFMEQLLTIEANEANRIKSETPVMCVIGNPPYAVSSSNKSDWILKLISDYKKGLHEQKLNLDDDYIKFIRFGQYFIDKNGAGVLAYISNNSFLGGVTHRQMRKHLLGSFDKIYILDLHGNARKKETHVDGSIDQNVFDIMQGVSINIFVKTGKKKAGELGEVYHYDLQGKRKLKYDFLLENTLKSVVWKTLKPTEPYLFFVPTDFGEIKKYEEGFKVTDLFGQYGSGLITDRDSLFFDDDKNKLTERIKLLLSGNFPHSFVEKYRILDSSGYNLTERIKKIKFDINCIRECNYRPFDKKYLYYQVGLTSRPGYENFKHILDQENISLLVKRQYSGYDFSHILISNKLNEVRFIENTFAHANVFPLYTYPEKPKQRTFFGKNREQEKRDLQIQLKYAKEHHKEIKTFFNKTVLPFYKAIKKPSEENQKLFEENRTTYEESKANVEKLQELIANFDALPQDENIFADSTERKPNFNKEMIEKFAKNLGLVFTNEKENAEGTFAPIDVLDYIYAVLHSPAYREKYKEFLKIDFPRVPFPTDPDIFWKLVKLGAQIRQIHLLESPEVNDFQTKYAQEGDDIVRKIRFELEFSNSPLLKNTAKGLGRVYINETQYFENVPELAWNFYIGGYQPAQKWLKDRKERKLEFDDILHYQKIIVALSQTDRLMKEVDLVL